MTASDNSINLGSLTASVIPVLDEAALKRSFEEIERDPRYRAVLPLAFDTRPATVDLKAVRDELDKLAGQGVKASREQVAASRSLEQQYKATGAAQVAAARTDAAESLARTARLREQAAQLSLTGRLAAQAASEEKRRSQAGIAALENEQRAYRNLWQGRQLNDEQSIAAQRRIYQQALMQAQAVDKQSDAYRRLTQIVAASQRTIDSAQGINTPGGFASGVSQGILNAVGNLGPFGQIAEQLAAVYQQYRAAQGGMRTAGADVGRAAGDGVTEGLRSREDEVRRAGQNTGSALEKGLKDELDIQSPSRVMRKLGAFAADGFTDGLRTKFDEALAAGRALGLQAQRGLQSVNLGASFGITAGSGLGAFSGVGRATAAQTGEAVQALKELPEAARQAELGAAGVEIAAEGMGGAVETAAGHVQALGDAHREGDPAARQTALNEAKNAVAFSVATAAVGALGYAMVTGAKKAAEYEQGLAEISLLTDKLPSQLGEVGTQILKIGATAGRSFAELKEAYLEILGASVKGTDTDQGALGFLERSVALAKATRSEVKTAADVLGSLINAYELDAGQAMKVSDMLWASIAAGKVSLGQLSSALGPTAGQAKALGVSMEELLSAMALLTTRGIPASTALEYIRSALTNVQKPSQDARDTAKDLGIQFSAAALKSMGLVKFLDQLGRGVGDNSEALARLIGDVGGLNAVLGLLNGGLDDTDGILGKVTDSAGELDVQVAKLRGTAEDNVNRFNASWERTQILFSGGLLGSFTAFLEKGVNPLLLKLGDLKSAMNTADTPGELKAVLTIQPGDDGTTQILKLLGGGVQVINAGLLTPATGQQSAGNILSDFVKQLSVSGLQKQLQEAGLIERKPYALGGAQQARDIAANLDRYQAMLANYVAATTAAGKTVTDAVKLVARPVIGPAPLVGSGPLLPGQNRLDPKTESGAFAYDFISRLTGVFKNDPKVASDCAVIATSVLQAIGIGIKGSAGARQLMQNALDAKFKEVDTSSYKNFRPGDLLTFEGPEYGALKFDKDGKKVGYHSAVFAGFDAQNRPTAIENPGSSNTRLRVLTEAELDKLIVLRSPQSPFAATPAAVNTKASTRPFTAPTDQALIAEARRILAKIEGYEQSGNLTGRAAAERVLKAFTEADPRAAAAIDYARSKLSELTKETSKDSLKARLGQAESLFKINADPAAYARSLEAISTAAQQAAATEKKQFGQTDKYSALYDLAGDAAGKARQQREAITRQQDTLDRDEAERTRTRLALQRTLADTLATGREADAQRLLEQLKTAQGKELALFEGNAAKQVAILTRTGPAIVAAEQRLANLRRDVRVKEAQRTADDAKALPGADLADIEATRQESVRQAYVQARSDRQKALDDQAKVERQAAASLAKEQQALRAKYNAERRDLDVAEQQATLNRTLALNQRELDAFKGTQAQRVALIKRQAQDEYNAREQAARSVRDKARAEAINLGGPNVGRTLAGIDQTYTDSVDAASGTQDTANRQALEGQAQAVRTAREAYAQLATGMREKIAAGRIEMADLAAYRTGLDAADTAARRAGVSTDALITGARASAAAVLELGVDVSATAPELDGLSDAMNRVAGQNVRYAVTLDRALQLIPGSVEANRTYVAVLADLERQGLVSAGTVATVTEAIADQEVVASLSAEALTRLTQDAVTAAQGLKGAGDSAGALDILTAALDAAMDASLRGEDAAEAIGKLTDEINRLTADQAVTDTLNTFVAGLSGTIDEQIAQTVAYVESVTDPKLLAKAKAFLADLRGQLPTYAPYAIPGQGRAPVSDGPDYQTIAAARDLKAQLELETDPAQLQGIIAEITALLASELGQKLPEATKAGLQAGITDAETYIGIQQGVGDAAAQGIRDGALRGTADAPPVPALPTSQYDALIDRVYALGDALKDPVQLTSLTESLTASRRAGELTEEQLQNLLALARDFAEFTVPPELQATLAGVQERVQTLTDDFDAGRITAAEFSAGLAGSGDDLGVLATEAEKLGNVKLAGMIRDFAASLRGLNPEIAGALKAVGKVQEVAGYVIQVAGAFGQFAAAMGEAEQDYDRFTGEKLQTPWKDLAANLQGIQALAQTVATVATDVMKLITNPADIGAWISLITTVVSSIADAIAGFQKAQAEVQKLKDDFVADNPFLNPEDYQKAYTRSRGFFADLFGGGPEVVNEIDKIGLSFAKTMQGAFASGIKEGLTEAIKKNDISLFSKTLKVAVGDAIISGIVESFIQSELIKNILAPAIKAWSDALKTTDDPNDDIAAVAGLDAAVGMVDQQASAFATQVLPRLEALRDKGYFGESGGTTDTGSLFGAGPEVQLGLGRVEVQFAADDLRGLHDLRDQVVPIMVSSFSDFRLMVGEFRQALATSGSRGAPPLSGLGGF
ncbi:phage tail tape measure protein [Deinococcus yunweiensis]|uniref:phage tail tape measure protein n=1 Tax=Deinococcus yunweiensis TaxID=367282 RepID=UPI00398EECB0